MAMITASDQRAISSAQPTEDELASKYTIAVEAIKAETNTNRGYSILVTVGSLDDPEFTAFFQSKGFIVQTVNDTFDIPPTSVRGEIRGTATYKLISWASTVIARPAAQISRSAQNTQYNWVITGQGPSVFYWRDEGTAQAADWTGAQTEGTVTITNGTGTVSRVLAPTATIGRTVIIRLYLDSDRTQLLTQSDTATITA